MIETKKYILFLLLFIFGISIGFFSGQFFNKDSSEIAALKEENAGLSSQIEKLKGESTPAPEMRYLFGKVIDVKGSSLVMETNSTQKKYFEGIPATITVLAGSSTKITRFEQKTTQEFQSDTERYNALVKNSPEPVNFPPPGSFKEVPVSMNEIAAGNYVVVDAGKDVKGLSEFTALKIMVQ